MKPETDFAGRQVAGSRDSQDDYYGFYPLTIGAEGVDGLLLVLADGMGGYAGGSLASRLVVEAFVENFCFCRGSISERLLSSLRASERRLVEEIARRDKSLSQMGSTLIGVVWTQGSLHRRICLTPLLVLAIIILLTIAVMWVVSLLSE